MTYEIRGKNGKKIFSDLTAREWAKRHEDGESLQDLSAQAAAKGMNISSMVISREIRRIGGIVLSHAAAARRSKQKRHTGIAFERQHGMHNDSDE